MIDKTNEAQNQVADSRFRSAAAVEMVVTSETAAVAVEGAVALGFDQRQHQQQLKWW